MNYKSKHRKYKIATILGKKYNDMDFHKIYNHYKKNMDISKMKIFTSNDYPSYIFYGYSKDYIYIEHNTIENIFILDYIKIWRFFEIEFGYDYQEIQELTTTILKEHLNIEKISIVNYLTLNHPILKKHLKLK